MVFINCRLPLAQWIRPWRGCDRWFVEQMNPMHDANVADAETESEPVVTEVRVFSFVILFARLGLVGTLGIVAFVIFFADHTIHVQKQGDATVYTSDNSFIWAFGAFAVLTAIITFLFATAAGLTARVMSAGMALITIWIIYMVITMDVSNHNVTVTPDGMSREVGTTSDPIRHSIDFRTTSYMFIDEYQDGHRVKQELVAYSSIDGEETRVPAFGMMQAAIPQILTYAGEHDIVVDASSWSPPE